MNNVYFNRLFVLSLSLTLVLFVSIYNIELLPLKYFYDSNTLLNVSDNVRMYSYSLRLFDSYYNTAAFYYFFMPYDDGNPPGGILRVVSAVLAWVPIMLSLMIFSRNRLGLHLLDSVVFIMGSVIAAIYCGQRSKELLAIWFAFFAFYFLYKHKLFLAFAMVLFYGIFFRVYWIVAIYIFSVLMFSVRLDFYVSRFKKLLIMVPLVAALPLLYNLLTGGYLTDHRFKINDVRFLEDNATLINNLLINSTVLHDLLNIVLSILRFLFPIELVILGGVKYLFFVLYWCLIVYGVVRMVKFKEDYSLNVLLLMLAMFITLTIFEPDFGSFVKHSLFFLPGYFLMKANSRVLDGGCYD